MRRSLFTLSCLLCLCALPLMAAEGLPATPQAAVDALSLERDIQTLMRNKKALAGVALLTEDGLCAGVHMDASFPLLSVIKFPLAVAVLEKMQHEQATLTTMIPVRAEQLHTGTHSPLRDQRGRRDMQVSLEDLLRYTVTFSDNNGCDILMEYVGGPAVVEACARRLGAENVFIGHDEDWMHQNIYNQYANWGTPRSMARMLLGFFDSPDISRAHKDFLADIMAGTPALPGKILEGLPHAPDIPHRPTALWGSPQPSCTGIPARRRVDAAGGRRTLQGLRAQVILRFSISASLTHRTKKQRKICSVSAVRNFWLSFLWPSWCWGPRAWQVFPAPSARPWENSAASPPIFSAR